MSGESTVPGTAWSRPPVAAALRRAPTASGARAPGGIHPLVELTSPDRDLARLGRALEATTDWPGLLARADHNRLSHRLAVVMRTAELTDRAPEPVRRLLRQRVTQAFLLERIHATAWEEVHGALERAGVRPLLLKGHGLAERLHESTLERVSSDIDLLVPAADLRIAEGVLGGLGYATNHRDYYLAHHFHLPYSRAHDRFSVTVELHWQVAKRASGVRFDVEGWCRRAAEIVTSAGLLRLPPPAEELAYTCYHALVRGAPTLRDLSDVARLWLRLPEEQRQHAVHAAARAGASGHLEEAVGLSRRLWGLDGVTASDARPRRRWLVGNLLAPSTVIEMGRTTWWPFRRLVSWALDDPARAPGLVARTLHSSWETRFEPDEADGGRAAVRLAALAAAAGLCLLPAPVFPAGFRGGR